MKNKPNNITVKYTQSPINISGAVFINYNVNKSHARINKSKYNNPSKTTSYDAYISNIEYNNEFENTTLDNVCGDITTKINTLKSILDIAQHLKDIAHLNNMFNDIITKYNIIYANIMPKYLKNSEKSKTNKVVNNINSFYRQMDKSCIINNMDWIVEQVEKYISKDDHEYTHIQKYHNCKNITGFIEKVEYLECEKCHVQCFHNVFTSELKCPDCGQIRIVDSLPSTDQLPSDYTNTSTYDINQRFIKIMNEVLAKTKNDPPKTIMDEMDKRFKLERIPKKEYVTCKDIRKWLKELNCGSKYNHLTSKIHKLFTGIIPPELSEDETLMLYNCYVKIINAFFVIKDETVKNSLYCRYFIYKLVSIKIKDVTKRHAIMDRIHSQEEETLKKNDDLWYMICNEVEELNGCYKPTNTHLYV